MAKKNKNPDWDIPYKCLWEARPNTGNITVKLFQDLYMSEAYMGMQTTSMIMYLYMSAQKHEVPISRKPDKRIDLFVFPKTLWLNKYHLCSNNVQFNKYCDELIERGFIELYQSGKNTRTPNVYKYSDKWQHWKKGDDFRPPEIKNRGIKEKLQMYAQDIAIIFRKWTDWILTCNISYKVAYGQITL